MSKNSIIPFLKDYLINFLTSPFLLDTNDVMNFMELLENMAMDMDRMKIRGSLVHGMYWLAWDCLMFKGVRVISQPSR